MSVCFFFFNDTATTEIYTLSLHDALPISRREDSHRLLRRLPLRPAPGARRMGGHALSLRARPRDRRPRVGRGRARARLRRGRDRKSTRLNSSHANISYAVFCLKKKKNNKR